MSHDHLWGPWASALEVPGGPYRGDLEVRVCTDLDCQLIQGRSVAMPASIIPIRRRA